MKVIIAKDNIQKEEAWKVVENVYPNIESRIPNHLRYRDKILSKAQILCAENDGRTAGMVAFYCNDFDSKVAYITQIAVMKSSQNKGVGGLLISKCEELSIQNGMLFLRLEVRKENLNAIKFYLKHGFEFEKEASGNSWYMKKSCC